MPESKKEKTLEEKYEELFRAFRSLNMKVNNNHTRVNERFSEIESLVESLKVNRNHDIEGLDELQKREDKVESELNA